MKTEKTAEAFTAETISMQLFSRLSFLPRAALLCALLALGAAAPLSETRAQTVAITGWDLLKEPGGTEEATTTAVYVPLYFEVELNQPARSDLKVEGHFTHTTTPGAPATVRPAYILQGQTTGSGLVVPGENLGEYLFGIASVLFTDGGGGEPMLPSPSTRLVTVEAGIIQGVGWNFEEIDPDETRITLAEGSTVGVVFQLGTIGDPNSDQGNTVWPVALHKGRPTSALRFTPPSVTPTYDTHAELTVGGFIIEAVDDGIPEPEQEITFEFEVRNGGRDGELAGYSLFFGTVTIPAHEMSDTQPELTLRLKDKRPFYEIGQPIPFELSLNAAATQDLTVVVEAATETLKLQEGKHAVRADAVTITAGQLTAEGSFVIDFSDFIPTGSSANSKCRIVPGAAADGHVQAGLLRSGLRNALLRIGSALFADGTTPSLNHSAVFEVRALPLDLRLEPKNAGAVREGETVEWTLSVERENLRCYVSDSEDNELEVILGITENPADGVLQETAVSLSLSTLTATVAADLTAGDGEDRGEQLTVAVTRVNAGVHVIQNSLTKPVTSFLDERTSVDFEPVVFPTATVTILDESEESMTPDPDPQPELTLRLKDKRPFYEIGPQQIPFELSLNAAALQDLTVVVEAGTASRLAGDIGRGAYRLVRADTVTITAGQLTAEGSFVIDISALIPLTEPDNNKCSITLPIGEDNEELRSGLRNVLLRIQSASFADGTMPSLNQRPTREEEDITTDPPPDPVIVEETRERRFDLRAPRLGLRLEPKDAGVVREGETVNWTLRVERENLRCYVDDSEDKELEVVLGITENPDDGALQRTTVSLSLNQLTADVAVDLTAGDGEDRGERLTVAVTRVNAEKDVIENLLTRPATSFLDERNNLDLEPVVFPTATVTILDESEVGTPTPLALQLSLARDALPEAFGATILTVSFTGDLPMNVESLPVELGVSPDHVSDVRLWVLTPFGPEAPMVELTEATRSAEVNVAVENDTLVEPQEIVTINATATVTATQKIMDQADLTIGWNDYAVQTLALEDAAGRVITQTPLTTTFRMRVSLNAEAPSTLNLTLRATPEGAGAAQTQDGTIPRGETAAPVEWTGGLPTVGNWVVSVISDPLPMFSFGALTSGVDASTATVTAQAQNLQVLQAEEPRGPYTLSLKPLEEMGGTVEAATATAGLPLWFEVALNQEAHSDLSLNILLDYPDSNAFSADLFILQGETTTTGFLVPSAAGTPFFDFFNPDIEFADGAEAPDTSGARRSMTVLAGSGVDIRVSFLENEGRSTITRMVADPWNMQMSIRRPDTTQEDVYHLRLFAWERGMEREVIEFTLTDPILTIPAGRANPFVSPNIPGEVLDNGSREERIIHLFAELREDSATGELLAASGGGGLSIVVVPESDAPPLEPLALQLTVLRGAFPEFGSTLMGLSFTGVLPAGETLTVNLSASDAHDSDTEPDVRLSPTSRELTNTQRSTDVGLTLVDDDDPEPQETVTIRATGTAAGVTVTPAERDVTIGWNDYDVETLTLTPSMVTLGGTFRAEVALNAPAPAGSDALAVMLIARHSGAAADETTTVRVVEGASAGSSKDWELEAAGTWTVEAVSDPLPEFDSSTSNVDESTATVTAQAQTLEIVSDEEEVRMTLGTADTSVLIPSMHEDVTSSQEIFQFALTDSGEDGFAANVENIVFMLSGLDSAVPGGLRGILCSDVDCSGGGIAQYQTSGSELRPTAEGFNPRLINNAEMADFHLFVWLDPSVRVADGSTFTVSIDSEGVTLAAGDDRSAIVPGQMLSSGEIRVEVQPDELAVSNFSPIYTYNRPVGVSSAVELLFTLWDEHGNRDLNTPVAELELVSLQIHSGGALSFDAADVQIVSTEPSTFTLTISRVTGGGAEAGGRTLDLTVQREYDSGGGTIRQNLEGTTVSRFTLNVVGNTLADQENMPARFDPDPPRSGANAHLRLRYRLLGCETAGVVNGQCQPDGNNSLTADTGELTINCSPLENCQPRVPVQQTFTLSRSGHLFTLDHQFNVPTLNNPGMATQLTASWTPGTSALNMAPTVVASIMASAQITGDTVDPTPPADFAEDPAQRQAYQLGFRWSAAMDQTMAGGPAATLDNADNYRLFYAEQGSGNCPAEDDTGYARATEARITPGADPAADGFTAVAGDAFDNSVKIKANTAYCIVLEVTDSANPVRTTPVSAITLEYSFADGDSDGLPDHLASLCVSCDRASREDDSDNDGINNVLEAYLAESAGVDVERSDAHSDANDNDIPDVIELHYGAVDERTTKPPFDTVICHASAWQTPALACQDENGSVSEGMRLLVQMDSQGEGVYVYDEMMVVDRNTWLGSGTHWLMDASRQLMRVDVLPLLALSGPAEVAAAPGERTNVSYSAEARLQGPPALRDGGFSLQFEARAPAHLFTGEGATVAPEEFTITDVDRVRQLTVTLPTTLTDSDDGSALSLTAAPADVSAATMSISRHSFADGAMTLSLRPLLSAVRLLAAAPTAMPHAVTPYLVDGGQTGTPRTGSVTLPDSGVAAWIVGASPGIADIEFSCVRVPGVLETAAEGIRVSAFVQFMLAAADRTDPAPSAPVPADAYFYNTDTLTVADCGTLAASEHLLGQFAFLVFPAGSEDEDRDGNLVADSLEGGPRGGAADSGAAGLRYEAADGAAYYLRSPGQGLRPGALAVEQGFGTPNLLESLAVGPAELTPPIPDILTVVDNLVLDFEAYCAESPNCMQAGALVRFVFQVSADIPPQVQYYKPAATDAGMGWCPMNADYSGNETPPLAPAALGCPDPHQAGLRDGLGFAAPDNGVCPPLGSAEYEAAGGPGVYLDAPQTGERCVQLSITNGGPNDRSSGVSNIVSDPGFLGVPGAGPGGDPEIKTFPDIAGGGSMGLPAVLLLGLLTLLSLFAVRRAGVSALRTLPLAGCAALLLALAPAEARAQEPAWLPDAVSAAGGATFLDPDTASAFEVDDDEDSGWRLGVEWLWRDGVRLLPALPESDLFVELSYADLGEATVCLDSGCTDDSEHEVEYEVWSLGVRSVWDWSHELTPWLGKPFAGVGYRYGRSNEDMGEKNGAYWNAGFEWELGVAAGRGFSLRAFYEAYDADAGAAWVGLAWHPRTERRVSAERPQVRRERVERRPAERRAPPTLMSGQCPVSVEDACTCLEPVGRTPAGWYVQVIAYSQRAQAQQMRDRLAREGLRRLGLRTLSGSRGVVHAVRVASPRSCAAAMEIKERVDGMLEVNALVRPWYQSPW